MEYVKHCVIVSYTSQLLGTDLSQRHSDYSKIGIYDWKASWKDLNSSKHCIIRHSQIWALSARERERVGCLYLWVYIKIIQLCMVRLMT